MPVNQELRAAIRQMLLPVSPIHEQDCLERASSLLNDLDIAEEDQPSWVAVQLRRWKANGTPSDNLREFVRSLLFSEQAEVPTYIFESLSGGAGEILVEVSLKISREYFTAHQALVANHLFSHDEARQILSHLGFIVKLRVEENMSASEISRLLSVRDARFDFNWPAIKTVLSKCGVAASIAEDEIRAIFEADQEFEPSLFADLDLPGCIQKIGASARSLGCPGNFEDWLTDLLIGDFHPAFLAMLHYQLSILERFDHALTYAYEFTPRGKAFSWLKNQYLNANIPVAGSPYLNNAKATLRLDSSWAIGRDNLRGATAAANILEQMENLGILARRELGNQIRCVLHRFIRTNAEAANEALLYELPPLNLNQLTQICLRIAEKNSATHGVLEQRLVDALTSQLHPLRENWRSKGIGDSVFAANTFRKKFGDCEFENTAGHTPTIFAYEAHGGNLTLPYVEDHLFSFASVLNARGDELKSHRDPAEWDITVVFIAHSYAMGLPATHDLDFEDSPITIRIEYTTFTELIESVGLTHEKVDPIHRLLIRPLNDHHVHPAFRRTVLNLLDVV